METRALYINFIGSARNEGYNLPAYVDIAYRGRKHHFPRDGVSVHRIHLPRRIFVRTRLYKFRKGKWGRRH